MSVSSVVVLLSQNSDQKLVSFVAVFSIFEIVVGFRNIETVFFFLRNKKVSRGLIRGSERDFHLQVQEYSSENTLNRSISRTVPRKRLEHAEKVLCSKDRRPFSQYGPKQVSSKEIYLSLKVFSECHGHGLDNTSPNSSAQYTDLEPTVRNPWLITRFPAVLILPSGPRVLATFWRFYFSVI